MKKLKLELTSKSVSVKDRKIKAKFTREQFEDLAGLTKPKFLYRIKSEEERRILTENVRIHHDLKGEIIYTITKIQLRKIKIGLLNSMPDFVLLDEIIKNSKTINTLEEVESILVDELSNTIGKEIVNNIYKLNKKE